MSGGRGAEQRRRADGWKGEVEEVLNRAAGGIICEILGDIESVVEQKVRVLEEWSVGRKGNDIDGSVVAGRSSEY